MTIPNWWQALLLASAAWRTFQLLSYDDILDGVRRRFLRLGNNWQKDGDPVPDNYRIAIGNFLNCPYCFGFWLAAAWWVAYEIWPHGTVVAAVPLALSAGVIALAKILSE